MGTIKNTTLLLGLALAAMAGSAWAGEGTGQYPAVFEENAGLPDHVVYRPESLADVQDGALGVYVFGNGGCSNDGTSSRNHLLEIASHGYLVIAPGVIPSQHPQPENGQPGSGQLRAPTAPEALTEAIDWAVRENDRPGSPYYHRLAPGKIAASGWSCGGLQAIAIAKDPRISTFVIMNSGVFNEGNPIAGLKVEKSMLADLHGSVIYVMGGPSDIAYANGRDDYSRISQIPAAYVDIPVGHGGTYMEPNGGIGAEIVTSWLDWQLKGDATAAARFSGQACGYCADTRIVYEHKNF
jgi:dienelactone hydrolase